MKKLALILGLFAVSSLSSCVIAVGIPPEEWDDMEELECSSCEPAPVCQECLNAAAKAGK